MTTPVSCPSPSAYARSGVDIDAAADAVGRMKAHVAATRLPSVLSSAVGDPEQGRDRYPDLAVGQRRVLGGDLIIHIPK